MTDDENTKFSVNLSMEFIDLPPFTDIMVVCKQNPHGKQSVTACIKSISRDDFEIFDVEDNVAEFIVVNQKLLKILPFENITSMLREKVFPFLSKGQMIKIDMNVQIHWHNIEGQL